MKSHKECEGTFLCLISCETGGFSHPLEVEVTRTQFIPRFPFDLSVTTEWMNIIAP